MSYFPLTLQNFAVFQNRVTNLSEGEKLYKCIQVRISKCKSLIFIQDAVQSAESAMIRCKDILRVFDFLFLKVTEKTLLKGKDYIVFFK